MNLQFGSWLQKYYIDPIVYDTGYNPVNTATWALLLGLSIFALIWAFRHLNLKMDEPLLLATVPYILAGSSLRVIEDAGLASPPASYLLITPLIYFLVFFAAAASLLLNRAILKSSFYWGYAAVGLIWTAINLAALSRAGIENALVPFAVLALGAAMAGSLYILRHVVSWLKFLDDRYNLFILFAHMLDASSTYIGVDWFGYYEKHVVPTILIGLTGTAAVMYPLKLLVLLPALSLIDHFIEDRSLRNLTKLVLITLGLAPAIRNTLRLTLGI